MKLQLSTNLEEIVSVQADTIVVAANQNRCLSLTQTDVEQALADLVANGFFKGETGEVCAVRAKVAGCCKTLIFTASVSEKTLSQTENTYAKMLKLAKKEKAKKIALTIEAGLKAEQVNKICESLYLADYTFEKFKTKDKKEEELSVTLYSTEELCICEGKSLGRAVNLARDLVNEPANLLPPSTLAEKAQEAGKVFGFSVKVYDEKEIEALGMGAFLAVAKGSDNPPRLIVMRYENAPDSKEVIGLVGKGLCYDSGGYSIKPTASMASMKSDMGGAAAVIGAMTAIAENKRKVNVVGVIAACENRISGHAYLPGDILTSMDGKTIEVDNTDAEGRLTLADAVTYAVEREKVTMVLDIATLTGAAIIALGKDISAVVSNNEDLWNRSEKASALACDKIWRMPADEDLEKLIQSDIADLKNSGGRYGGVITAGLFIKAFAKDLPWIHFDIAGPSFTDGKELCAKGGTGAGTRLLYHIVKGMEV